MRGAQRIETERLPLPATKPVFTRPQFT